MPATPTTRPTSACSTRSSRRNPATVDWWEQHDSDPTRGRTKRIRLDTGQVIQLRQLVLQVAEEPDIRVISYFADADGDLDDVEFDS